MNALHEIEQFKNLILKLELPRHDFALFGVMCPYCGKNDRIHKLEAPAEMTAPPEAYTEMWNKYSSIGDLAVCNFCRQVLALSDSRRSAAKLAEL